MIDTANHLITLAAVREKHPDWTVRRSTCPEGCHTTYEASRHEGTAMRYIVRFTLGELDLKLDHPDRKKQQ